MRILLCHPPWRKCGELLHQPFLLPAQRGHRTLILYTFIIVLFENQNSLLIHRLPTAQPEVGVQLALLQIAGENAVLEQLLFVALDAAWAEIQEVIDTELLLFDLCLHRARPLLMLLLDLPDLLVVNGLRIQGHLP